MDLSISYLLFYQFIHIIHLFYLFATLLLLIFFSSIVSKLSIRLTVRINIEHCVNLFELRKMVSCYVVLIRAAVGWNSDAGDTGFISSSPGNSSVQHWPWGGVNCSHCAVSRSECPPKPTIAPWSRPVPSLSHCPPGVTLSQPQPFPGSWEVTAIIGANTITTPRSPEVGSF